MYKIAINIINAKYDRMFSYMHAEPFFATRMLNEVEYVIVELTIIICNRLIQCFI